MFLMPTRSCSEIHIRGAVFLCSPIWASADESVIEVRDDYAIIVAVGSRDEAVFAVPV